MRRARSIDVPSHRGHTGPSSIAGCGSDDESSGGGGDAKKSVIYVSTNPLGTNQFLNLIADGAKAGGEECGATVKVVQSSDPNSLAANLRAAVQAKPDLIVANSFDSVETISGLVKQSPDQKWALVDAAVEKAPNVRGILFKENEGMFLIGAAYALLAKGDQGAEWPASKAVGFVGAIDNALVRRWYNGYAQGVNDTSPGTRVLARLGQLLQRSGDLEGARAVAELQGREVHRRGRRGRQLGRVRGGRRP